MRERPFFFFTMLCSHSACIIDLLRFISQKHVTLCWFKDILFFFVTKILFYFIFSQTADLPIQTPVSSSTSVASILNDSNRSLERKVSTLGNSFTSLL